MLKLFSKIIENKSLILDLARADFKKRFAGSYFGVLWMFIQPVVTVLIYFCIFQLGFKSAPPVPDTPYVLWLVPGIVPWFFFSEGVTAGTNCLGEYHYLVKKVVFDVEFLPVIKLISCMIIHGIFVIIMIGMFFCYGRLPIAAWLQLPYYAGALAVLILAVTYMTSAINVFFRDMAQIVNIGLQFGMWLTPIMWDPVMFPNRPGWLETLLKLNPLYYIAAGYRDSMLTGAWFWQRPGLTAYFWLISLALLALSRRLFCRLRPHFSDVL